MENNCFDVEFSLMYYMNLWKLKLLSVLLIEFKKGRCLIRKYNVMFFFGWDNVNKFVMVVKKIIKRMSYMFYN